MKIIKVLIKSADINYMIQAQRPNILVVEDNPRNAALIEGYLRPYYNVTKAVSGEECLDLIKNEKIDLIIMDVVLPGINGYDVCRKIKGNGSTKKIPIMLIPALPTGQEKTRSLKAGAEDFIDRPFTMSEIVARARALLKIKNLYEDIERAQEDLSSIISYTTDTLKEFDYMTFNENTFQKTLLKMLLRKKPYESENPTHVLLGKKDNGNIIGNIFTNGSSPMECIIPENFYLSKGTARNGHQKITYSNHTEKESILEYQEHFHQTIRDTVGKIINFTTYISNDISIIAFNYGRPVTPSDAQVIKGLTIHIPFFKSLSKQINEANDMLLLTVNTLSRAAEANDEDTGNHILRVGKYSAILAKRLGLPEKFVHEIGIASQMHDVGKIHIRPDILRKPGRLSPDEFEVIKQHPVNGARLLGEHPKLKMAQVIALTHHERWDGSGYPYGLKGDIIPIEGRILHIADQYDVLRANRPYRPAYSHAKAFKIITDGDGRTMPFHFDPDVLQAFKEVAVQMDGMYTELQG